MTDKTLQDRLRQQAITADEFGYLDHARALNGAADALDAQAERIKALEGALRGIMPYWTHAWDLVEGGLFIDKQSVKKFDAAFQRARALLEGK